jgi:hypothetical protein
VLQDHPGDEQMSTPRGYAQGEGNQNNYPTRKPEGHHETVRFHIQKKTGGDLRRL